jgi:hypothetical protein
MQIALMYGGRSSYYRDSIRWRSSIAREIADQSKANLLALALGVTALGATAIGALAIGRLVVGRLLVKHVHFREPEVDTLTVRRLRVVEREGPNG